MMYIYCIQVSFVMSYTQLVRLDTTVKAELDEIGKKKETYSDIIRRLLETNKERLSVSA